MNLKRLLVLTGAMALMGMLWASPVAADGHLPSITLDPASVPAEEGDVTITVNGSNFKAEVAPFLITTCPKAQGDPTLITDQVSAFGHCPLLASDLTGQMRDVEVVDGSFSYELTVTITQAEIDVGALVILASWAKAGATTEDGGSAALIVADEDPMDDDMGEESMDDDMGEESMDDDMGDESMDDDMGDEELPDTGSESNVLVIVGAGILLAGVLVIGAGRRVRTATR